MGIERSKVVEVHAQTSPAGSVGTGYVVGDRLVLTSARHVGRRGPTSLRPAGTGPWLSASTVWSSEDAGASLLEVDDLRAPGAASGAVQWGEVAGNGAIGVTASGFPPTDVRPERFRDPEPFYGRVSPGGPRAAGRRLAVSPTAGRQPGNGMSGAALFAGAALVGVLLVDAGGLLAVPVQTLAEDAVFVSLVAPDGLRLVPVRAPALALPIFQMP